MFGSAKDLLWNLELKNKGFDFLKLPPQTLIVLKTRNSSYELEPIANRKAVILGGKMPDQSLRFPVPTIVSPLGSAVNNGMVPKENWIGFGMHFEFVVDETQQFIVTSQIQDAEIHAKDKSWSYLMDWSKTVEPIVA